MVELYRQIQEAVAYLRDRWPNRPRVALILGTGLGGVAEGISVECKVPYKQIPNFPESTVQGHEGNLLFGAVAGCNVVVMQGRLHYYEGYTLQQATLPVRIMRSLGAEFLLVNSAAGGLNPLFRADDVMAVTDHINLMGANPLRGLTDERLGDRFPDMTCPYDPEMIRVAGDVALDLRIALKYGVYAAVAGPSIETRAETRMLRILGADAVGMSTVPEVIVASQVGFRTMVLAAITNVNLPDTMQPVDIEKVIASAQRIQPTLAALMGEIVFRVCRE